VDKGRLLRLRMLRRRRQQERPLDSSQHSSD
jgi:hypothetical protein